ncbi:MAG TPA: ABC transporter permease [Pyrinomonadaceae bacterium]|nr:ABC transporter permease [Pyrinomonadaceae bacterium]
MTTFIALLHRDLRVVRREMLSFLLRVVINPLLFTFIFGFVMPRMGIIQRGYTDMLLPGILGLSMTLSSMQAVSLPLVIDFGWSKEIEDRLLAPISIVGVGVEKIVVGVIQAIVAGLVVLPLAWLMMRVQFNLTGTDILHFVIVALLSSWLFAAFGMVVGTVVSPQQISLVFTVLLAPMIFFGCAYYPWATLHVIPWFQYAVLINPLVYANEGFRLALTPQMPHMPSWLVYAALIGFSVFFTWAGLRKFESRALD